MGIQGLRKYIDGCGVSRVVGPANASTEAGDNRDCAKVVDHVLFDMNGVIHAGFGSYSSAGATAEKTIDATFNIISEVFDRFTPEQSVTFAFDGPCPFAKIKTQRQRRRRNATVDGSAAHLFSGLNITTGSDFMTTVTQRLEELSTEFLSDQHIPAAAVTIAGPAVEGEGESKITAQLLRLVQQQHEAGTFDPNQRVLVVGNDIDLVLSCIACLPLHNLAVLSPGSFQAIDVGLLLTKWFTSQPLVTQCFSTEGAPPFVSAANFLQRRVDFVFLFLCNGGDHYDGLGEVGADLWKRYRTLCCGPGGEEFRLLIVEPDGLRIDVANTVKVMTSNVSGGTSTEGTSHPSIVEAIMWSTYTLLTGVCPDYHFATRDVTAAAVTLSVLRSSIKQYGATATVPLQPQHRPLSAAEHYTAVMPHPAYLNPECRTALQKARDRDELMQLFAFDAPVEQVVALAQRIQKLSSSGARRGPEGRKRGRTEADSSAPSQPAVIEFRRRLTRGENGKQTSIVTKKSVRPPDIQTAMEESLPLLSGFTYQPGEALEFEPLFARTKGTAADEDNKEVKRRMFMYGETAEVAAARVEQGKKQGSTAGAVAIGGKFVLNIPGSKQSSRISNQLDGSATAVDGRKRRGVSKPERRVVESGESRRKQRGGVEPDGARLPTGKLNTGAMGLSLNIEV